MQPAIIIWSATEVELRLLNSGVTVAEREVLEPLDLDSLSPRQKLVAEEPTPILQSAIRVGIVEEDYGASSVALFIQDGVF